MRGILTGLAFIVATAGAPALADDELPKKYSDDQLVELLKNLGYRAVQKDEDRVLTISIDGHTYYLYVYGDDDLQLYFGLTGFDVTVDDMNEWNRTRRLSRAYMDQVDDPVLEADLLANAGYSPKQLGEWISVFAQSAREFHQYVTSVDRSE